MNELNEQEYMELLEPWQVKWTFEQFPGCKITMVNISFVKYKRDEEPRIPLHVEGTVEIETRSKIKTIPFKLYHGILSIDLRSLPYNEPQKEIIKDTIVAICKSSKITIGDFYTYITKSQLYSKIFIWMALGAIACIGFLGIIGKL